MSVLNCEICFEHNLLKDRGDNPPYSTNCGHIFHRDCLFAWVRQKHNCPKCRAYCEERSIHQIFFELGNDESLGAVGGAPSYINNTSNQCEFLAEIEYMSETIENLRQRNEELMELLKAFGDQVEEKDSTIKSLNTEMEAMALHSVDWHQTLDCAMTGQEAAATQVKKNEAFIETLCTEICRLKKKNFLVEQENQNLKLKAENTVQPSRSNRQLYQPSRNREENPRPFFSVDDMLNFTELDNNPRASSSSSRQREDIINYEDFFPPSQRTN